MHIINCEINVILTWYDRCVLSYDTKSITFSTTDIKCHVPVVTLATQDNQKLLEQSK